MKPSEQRPTIPASRAERIPRAIAHRLRRDAAARARQRDQVARQGRPRLREWHTLNRHDRAAAWSELVLWTTWLYDRYGLGTDWRLPDCWPEHPGIIEELWLLKTWREEIYDGGSEIPLNQQAGAWHAHLQAFTHAVKTFYAPGCRSGHKSAAEAAWNGRLQREWIQGDPAAGIPLPYLLHPGVPVTEALTIDADAMDIAFTTGHAERRLPALPDFCVYDSRWWKRSDKVWLCLDAYPELRADLDDYEQRSAKANASASKLRELLAGDEPRSRTRQP